MCPRDSSSSSSEMRTAGIDDAARSDRAPLPGDDPGRDLPDLVGLVVDDDGVAGVRPALVAADQIGLLREQVDDLALPLVAPLRADDDGRGHAGQSTARVQTLEPPRPRAPALPRRRGATAETFGRPDAAHGLSAPARSPTMTSGSPPSERRRREQRQRSRGRETADDECRADGARLAERAQADLAADAPGARDHRVEGDDRRALLRRHDLVQVGGANRARDAHRRREEEQRGERDPERPGEAERDSRDGLHALPRREAASCACRSSATRS